MFIRALVAFLALPGVVAGLLPVLIASGDTKRHDGSAIGFGFLAVGVVLLFWCVRDFYVLGKGTLAPWDPPKRLVVVGLYRFVRNPMYVAVLTVVLGWTLVFGCTWLAFYLVALAIGFHLRVLFYEEPRLRQQFATQWSAYSAAVPRWLPRLGTANKETRS
jgi:protein-S-isoprenylcysteine O-methyltransferase Ste14